jgi:hypothetical protein
MLPKTQCRRILEVCHDGHHIVELQPYPLRVDVVLVLGKLIHPPDIDALAQLLLRPLAELGEEVIGAAPCHWTQDTEIGG